MPNILIRDVPDDIYQQIAELAKSERRSIPAEALHVIEQGVWQLQGRQAKHNEAIASLKRRMQEKPRLDVESVDLIRESREQ